MIKSLLPMPIGPFSQSLSHEQFTTSRLRTNEFRMWNKGAFFFFLVVEVGYMRVKELDSRSIVNVVSLLQSLH